MSPLITKHGRHECVVCGGTGTGQDGVYAVDENEEEADDKPVDVATIDPELLPENVSCTCQRVWRKALCQTALRMILNKNGIWSARKLARECLWDGHC
jgi:hypothetical protein